MKVFILTAIIFISSPLLSGPLHLDLEMSSDEYRLLLKNMRSSNKFIAPDQPEIAEALQMGERLSKWIAKVNEIRTPEQAIRLTSAATRRGIPINKPNMYSPSIIKAETTAILSEVPNQITNILISQSELPTTLPVDDEQFIIHARRIDRNYQSAARYKSVDVWRNSYIQAANRDVRGLYYLETNKIGETELRDIDLIPAEKVSAIKAALTQICQNSLKDLKRCSQDVEKAFSENKLSKFYSQYIQNSRKIWNNFFKIPVYARRSDVSWTDTLTTVPFNTPEIPKFIPYLQDNIEDEFRWKGWKLKLRFGDFPLGPILKFQGGVVPHVNGLGGNEIVMDANQPIEEYESQWTIRHEFGHVIGLPDCYHEFYDTKARAYVNYQLDITDLMCSRAGNMKERIYKELEEAYGER
jgi:hypothetical protein